MHIWKVGYQSCTSCRKDSRVVASLLDEAGVIVEQKLFCEDHAPWLLTLRLPPMPENTTVSLATIEASD
jgi:hypothetical protein